MVDVERRRRAASLVAQIRDGLITNDQFEDAYPRKSREHTTGGAATAGVVPPGR